MHFRLPLDKPTIIILVLLAVIPLSDLLLPSTYAITPLLPPILIFAFVAIGLTVISGCAGILHLGIGAVMAIGAYAYAILTAPIYPFQIGFWPGLLCAAVVSGVVGYGLGLPTIRLRGDYLAIVTLGFGEIIQDVLRNLEVITKGTMGINPLPAPTLFSLGGINSSVAVFYILLVLLIAVIFFVERIRNSYIGRSWTALDNDELAALHMGINTTQVKLSTLALGSGLAGLGGALSAALLGSSGEPSNYDFQVSIMALSMIIVGGLGSTSGALLGTLVMVGINSVVLAKLTELIAASGMQTSSNVLLSPTNWKYLIFGLALVIMMRFKSDGLLPQKTQSRERR